MIIAIYGKIGSGKSTVLELLRKKGKRTASCDEIYRNVVVYSPDYIEQIDKNCPGAVKEGEIDLKALAEIVYNDKIKLAKLDSLAHPQIRACLKRILDGFSEAYAEVPLLIESGWKDMFDACVYVRSSREARVERVAERDGKDEESVARWTPPARATKSCWIAPTTSSTTTAPWRTLRKAWTKCSPSSRRARHNERKLALIGCV